MAAGGGGAGGGGAAGGGGGVKIEAIDDRSAFEDCRSAKTASHLIAEDAARVAADAMTLQLQELGTKKRRAKFKMKSFVYGIRSGSACLLPSDVAVQRM